MCRFLSIVLSFVMICLARGNGFAAEGDQVPKGLSAAVGDLVAALPQWKIHRIDQRPSVAVDGQRGYRVVLRMTWKELPPELIPQQQLAAQSRLEDDPRAIPRHTDWHFVLVPVGDAPLGPDAKRDILWHIPDEKSYRLPVAMGEGYGHAWFSYTTIPMQHFLRARLKLEGGDDRLQLALRGLSVVDEGMNTLNSVLWYFHEFGEEGFAALDDAIHTSHDPTNAIRALTQFRDDKATARLVQLYQSSDPKAHRAAAYTLINQPYRRGAKATYLDMIERQLHVNEAMQAALEFGWKDALPLIEHVLEEPSSIGAYRDAYKTWRQLSGRPLDAKLSVAANVIYGLSGRDRELHPTEAELEAARRTMIEHGDVEGSAFVALNLATFVTKGNTARVNSTGIEILRALPRPTVEKLRDRLLNGLPDGERKEIEKVFEQVTA